MKTTEKGMDSGSLPEPGERHDIKEGLKPLNLLRPESCHINVHWLLQYLMGHPKE